MQRRRIGKIENCQNYRILKIYLDFSTHCARLSRLFLSDYSSDRFQILYFGSTNAEVVQRRGFGWKH